MTFEEFKNGKFYSKMSVEYLGAPTLVQSVDFETGKFILIVGEKEEWKKVSYQRVSFFQETIFEEVEDGEEQ
jgi:hypothetical protein